MAESQLVSPKDPLHSVYWNCLLLGCGVLLTYNLLITCADYFIAEFPDHPNLMFYIVPASAFTQLLFLIIMIMHGHKYTFTSRIVPAFIISAIAVSILPIFVHQLPESQGFWLVLATASFQGIITAILQSSIVGFCNFLPSAYIQISFGGQAVSGIVACIIRIITKFYDIYGGITAEQGGIVYFVTGALFNILCAMSFIFVFYRKFTQYWLTKTDDDDIEISAESKESDMLNGNSPDSLIGAVVPDDGIDTKFVPLLSHQNNQKVSYKSVFLKIWKCALSVFLVFYVTLLMFPGLLVGINSQYSSIQHDAWMPVILTVMCLLCFCDLYMQQITSYRRNTIVVIGLEDNFWFLGWVKLNGIRMHYGKLVYFDWFCILFLLCCF